MGCAVCGHAPYAHGCPGQAADHEYAQPSGELMAERLDVRHRLGLGQALTTFEPAHEVAAYSAAVVPAPRQVERETPSARTRPAGRTDTRRPALPGTGRPYRPVEPREDRAARLALAHDPLTRRRALLTARAPEHSPQIAGRASERPPQNTGRRTRHPRPGEPAAQRTLTVLPDIPSTGDRHRIYQTSRPGLAVAPGRDHSPDSSSSWRHNPNRQEVAA